MPEATDGGRARNAALASALLSLTLGFGWLAGVAVRNGWLAGGVVATAVVELLAYRRARAVGSTLDRPSVSVTVAALAGVAIGAGAILVPDRSLSFAVGALVAYLCLLGVVVVTGWVPASSSAD